MSKCLLILVAVAMAACGGTEDPATAPATDACLAPLQADSTQAVLIAGDAFTVLVGDVDDKEAEEHVKFVAKTFATYRNLDLTKLTIIVDRSSNKEYCQGLADGCTTPAGSRIVIAVPWTGKDWTKAELLSHELGHAFELQSAHDGDANHIHHELFARANGEYASYEGEIGVASLVATYVTSHADVN